MHFLRRSALGFTASLLVSLLFTFGILLALKQVFSTPSYFKSALSESGFYRDVVKNGLDQTQKEAPSPDEIPLGKQEVRQVIERAVPPQLLQTKTEGVIDDFYAWLQGRTPELNFAVKVDDVKTNLAVGLEDYIKNRLSSLPPCEPNTALDINTNPFNAPCLPRGADPAQAAAQAKNEILAGEFLKDNVITADNIKNDSGQTLDEQLKNVPAYYRAVNNGVMVLGALAAALALAVFFLSVDKRSGLKKLGIIFISVGAVSALLAWISGIAASGVVNQANKLEPLAVVATRVMEQLVRSIRAWWLGYAISLMVLGLAALIYLRLSRKDLAEAPAEPTGEMSQHSLIDEEKSKIQGPKTGRIKKINNT